MSHLYCILCNACLCEPSAETLLAYQGASGEGPFIHEDQVYWLRKTRIIGRAKVIHQHSKTAFLTGPVLQREEGLSFLRGTAHDINFGGSILKGKGSAEVVHVPSVLDMELRMEFESIHERCCLVLWHFLTYKRHISCPLEELGQIVIERPTLFKSLVKQGECEYEAYELSMGSTKEHVCDPYAEGWLPRLLRGSDALPKAIVHYDQPYSRKMAYTKKQVSMDGFAMLPPELLWDIASYLEPRQIRMLCLASGAASGAVNHRAFWLRRIGNDLPWIWELQEQNITESTIRSLPTSIDWLGFYFKLLDSSVYHSAIRDLGLVNRRRIWKICEKLDLDQL